jgi:AcrR family transcriptional regulator
MTIEGPVRPLRRDAAVNRQRVLDAAARVFATRGLEASVEEIAKAAGVGMGTLYRRFPTKETLISALVDDVLDQMQILAADAATRTDGTGLEYFLTAASAYQAQHRGCLPRLWASGTDHRSVARVRRAVDALLQDAQTHGRIRADVTPTDLTVVMWSVRGVIETTGDVVPDAWQRHLGILVAGLRPAGEPLANRPLSRRQVDDILS